jgi:hypothetical protein
MKPHRLFSLAVLSVLLIAPSTAYAGQAEISSATCRPSDFRSFFEQLLRTSTFRKSHLAPIVQQRRGRVVRSIPRAQYNRLPITLMDNYYVTTQSAAGDPRNWEIVKLDINMAQDERVRVDWVRVKRDGRIEGDEGPRTKDVEYGPRGYLIFAPAGACWQLTNDGVR